MSLALGLRRSESSKARTDVAEAAESAIDGLRSGCSMIVDALGATSKTVAGCAASVHCALPIRQHGNAPQAVFALRARSFELARSIRRLVALTIAIDAVSRFARHLGHVLQPSALKIDSMRMSTPPRVRTDDSAWKSKAQRRRRLCATQPHE